MKYFQLSSGDASALLTRFWSGQDADYRSRQQEAGQGDDWITQRAEKLSTFLVGYCEDKDNLNASDEAYLSPVVHKLLQLPHPIAADGGFWRWLQIAICYDAVMLRHGQEDGRADPKNFGVGQIWEGFIARMWLRADIAYDGARNDPYELSRRGNQDFWRSHVFRQLYSCNRDLAQAFVEFQYPQQDGPPRLHPSDADGIRMLAKRLKRAHATRAIDLFPADKAQGFLSDLSRDLR